MYPAQTQEDGASNFTTSSATTGPWDLPTAYSAWGPEEHEAMQRVIRSGQFTIGPEVRAFEEEFAAHHNMKYCIMVNSGSSANLIMIAALFAKKHRPLKRGDVALVPAIAWATTYSPLIQYGLRLKLMDVDDSWNCQLPDVSGARLVVGCSILGNPAPLGFLKTAAESHDEFFIEDNCESLGAWHGVKRCGTFGLMNSFSFYYSHQISAIEGGCITTNDSELNQLCRILRAHGWTRDVYPPTCFEDEYNFTHFSYNVRPLEMHAAIAREQLKKLDGFIKLRRANHQLFVDLTKGLPIKHPVIRGEPSPFGLAFSVASSETRRKLVAELREAKTDARLPTGGSFTQHAYGRPWADQATPKADEIHRTGLFLGNGPFDLSKQITKAVDVMKRVL